MSSNEIQPAVSRGISLRSLLLLLLLVGVCAGTTAYVVGSAFAASKQHGYNWDFPAGHNHYIDYDDYTTQLYAEFSLGCAQWTRSNSPFSS